MPRTMTQLIETLAYQKANRQKQVDKFIADLQQRPFHTMRWAEGPAVSIAALEVFTRYHAICTDENFSEDILPAMRDRLVKEIIQAGASPERSTSAMSNIMHQNVTIAYTEVLAVINEYLED